MAGTNKVQRYHAYPEYKDSGVEWLGEIPSGWTLSKLRYKFTFGKGLTITKENLQDEGVPCISYGEVHSKYGFEIDPNIHLLKCVNEQYLKNNQSSLLLKGDIIFADTSEDIDGSGNFTQLISDGAVFAGYHTIIARPQNRKNSRFWAYLLDCKEFRTQIRYAVKGVKVFSITQAILRNLSIWLPSKLEQEHIISFLDHETTKIDTLIEKQQHLIELLKEKRQAVISHAVTKGLNPNVPMKDSGVEWLGEVPEHWKVLPTKRLFRLVTEPSETNNNHELLSVYTAVGVAPRKDLEPKGNKASSTDGYWIVKRGDIIVNKLLAWMGAVGYSNYDGVTSPAYDILRKINDINPKFYHYLFRLDFTQQEFKRWSRGIMEMRLRLYFEELGRIMMPIPPKSEQDIIVEKIEKLENQYSQLENIATRQIELLQERRTALISAAVTGKIDVRHWVAPTDSES
ncbi:restriction endonuclease subunit S [Zophobihabitans entericus]|uniref:Restriction endonuclease subunit S n=1 Tax=Zophobihabitans entericus TaxID=1635327 RepID=A0A6G9ID65_9GAMM|nr:restriction endonuclease subunit S [Zophobihabitans entericus]QIQ22176.1 restriction endonuclease subunit S [Zophobihabitans entericus]